MSSAAKEWPEPDPAALPVEVLLSRLDGVTGTWPTWSALCPAHHDTRPSLSVTEADDGRALVYDHAGCRTPDILAEVGLTEADLFPSGYALAFGPRRFAPAARARRADVDTTVVPEPAVDRKQLIRLMREAGCGAVGVGPLARKLGLPASAVARLEVGRAGWDWAFPERDGRGRVVGLAYRRPDGSRYFAKHGKRGLIIPTDLAVARGGTVYLAEGASDTAALLAAGQAAVGRPAAGASKHVRQWAAEFLTARAAHAAVAVVADRDDSGERGAVELARYLTAALGRPVAWCVPDAPFKDARDVVVAGAWPAAMTWRTAE